ncbi:MAG: hypothetical protein AB7P49_17140 [Bdellovibrionales bacterium]
MELVRAQAFLLALLFAAGTLLGTSIEGAMRGLGPSEQDSRWMFQLSLGIWDLIEGLLLILILSRGVTQVDNLSPEWFEPKPFSKPFLSSFLAEYLRMLAQVLLWGLLLLIPGFVRYGRLAFVPLIAIFSRAYREGQADALELSAELSRGRMWVILTVIFLTSVSQAGLEFLPQMYMSLYVLPVRVGFTAVSFLISVWTYSFLFLLFEQAVREKRYHE